MTGRKLTQAQWDTLCSLDNVRRSLASISADAHHEATSALRLAATAVLGAKEADALMKTLANVDSMDWCLRELGYSIITPPASPKVYIVVGDCVPYIAHVTSDSANHWVNDNRIGDSIHPVDLIVTDADIGDARDLDILAYVISDEMDKGDHGMPDVGQDDLRAALPVFLALAAAHARANSEG